MNRLRVPSCAAALALVAGLVSGCTGSSGTSTPTTSGTAPTTLPSSSASESTGSQQDSATTIATNLVAQVQELHGALIGYGESDLPRATFVETATHLEQVFRRADHSLLHSSVASNEGPVVSRIAHDLGQYASVAGDLASSSAHTSDAAVSRLRALDRTWLKDMRVLATATGANPLGGLPPFSYPKLPLRG